MTMSLAIGVQILLGMLLLNGAAARPVPKDTKCEQCGQLVPLDDDHNADSNVLESAGWSLQIQPNGSVSQALCPNRSNCAINENPQTYQRSWRPADLEPLYEKCNITETVMNGTTETITVKKKKRRFRFDRANNILYTYALLSRLGRDVGEKRETINLNDVAPKGFRKIKNKEFMLTMNVHGFTVNNGMLTDEDTKAYTFTGCNYGNVRKVAKYIKDRLKELDQELDHTKVNWKSFGESDPGLVEPVLQRSGTLYGECPVTPEPGRQRGSAIISLGRRRRLLSVARRNRLLERLQGF